MLAPQAEELAEDGAEACSSYVLHPFPLGSAGKPYRVQHLGREVHDHVTGTTKLLRMSDSLTRPTFHPR